ncbi:MAG: heme-binding protein [Pseudonocardiaceae bacterium]
MTEAAATAASLSIGISSVRLALDIPTILGKLGLLGRLAGTWQGTGFNLIARPDFHDNIKRPPNEVKVDTYLQLNQTRETLKFDPINASIPNRGFGQDDIELFGLTYFQQIFDTPTGGLLHVEPGLWITQQDTTYPPEKALPNGQIVSRLGSIPHGTTVLAQGTAQPFTGPPALKTPTAEYAFSQFPSFNSTTFAKNPPPPILNAAGSSEKLTPPGFPEYDLTVKEGINNPRTPFGTTEPPLPAQINGVPMQVVVNDPITLLQAVIKKQVADGDTFTGVALNIASQKEITFFTKPNSQPTKPNDPNFPTVTVHPTLGTGGNQNIPFLEGGEPPGPNGANAVTTLVYATFWITEVHRKILPPFKQLQYAQMVILDFEVASQIQKNNHVNLGWPHISVATLTQGSI